MHTNSERKKERKEKRMKKRTEKFQKGREDCTKCTLVSKCFNPENSNSQTSIFPFSLFFLLPCFFFSFLSFSIFQKSKYQGNNSHHFNKSQSSSLSLFSLPANPNAGKVLGEKMFYFLIQGIDFRVNVNTK